MVALAICADGTKVPVGLSLGDTEKRRRHPPAGRPRRAGADRGSPPARPGPARQLETRWPDAAASLRERLEDMRGPH